MALKAGVNLIDTADIYSGGLAEEIVGSVLEGRRHEVLIASKARFPMGPGPNDAGLSRRHLIESCEASLRRLRTDHIDLYQVHEWDGHTPLEETLAAPDHLLQSGKVRYVGCSNFAGWQVMKALCVAEATGLPRFVSQQKDRRRPAFRGRSLADRAGPSCFAGSGGWRRAMPGNA